MPRPLTMLYLISYDVPSTKAGQKRRARLAKFLESLGLRVQYSVFELVIDPSKLPLVVQAIEDLIRPDQDSVRIYTCCASCAGRAFTVGLKAVCEHETLIVF